MSLMRIISLLPAATEIVCALGAASALVGISHDSDHPPELLDPGIPRVTRSTIDADAEPAEIDRMVRVADSLGESLHVLDAEAIAELEPDVIITQGICDVCAIRESDVRFIAQSLRHPIAHVLTGCVNGDDRLRVEQRPLHGISRRDVRLRRALLHDHDDRHRGKRQMSLMYRIKGTAKKANVHDASFVVGRSSVAELRTA